jgi:hypothetical protein
MKKTIFILAASLLLTNLTLAEEDLIPDTPPARVYNYYCTWAAQGYVYGQGLDHLDWNVLLKADAGSAMHESLLTNKNNGLLSFFPEIRSDLWFLLDDGYYAVPGSKTVEDKKEGMTSMKFDVERFPSCAGKGPADCIAIVSRLIKERGWHGLGLWSRGYPRSEDQAREKLEWSRAGDVGYWKIDTGDAPMNYCRLRSEIYPGLILEHSVWAHGVYTGKGETNMKQLLPSTVVSEQHAFMRGTDVVRIYDCDQPLGQITALLRTAGLLADASGDSSVTAIINTEDHVSIAGALGCSAGVLRFPIMGKRPDGDPDVFNAGPRHVKKRIDEVVRVLRWQRLAPPIKANALPVNIDEKGFADTWTVVRGETWNKITGPVTQSAPARISRGLSLPEVRSEGDAPFVLACRHPQGPLTVTTLGRFANSWGYHIPLADISLDVGTIPQEIGIFGRYQSLTLRFSESVVGRHVLAQDIMAKKSVDITHEVMLQEMELKIPGKVIDRVGSSAASPGDESDPGMVLKLVQ